MLYSFPLLELNLFQNNNAPVHKVSSMKLQFAVCNSNGLHRALNTTPLNSSGMNWSWLHPEPWSPTSGHSSAWGIADLYTEQLRALFLGPGVAAW